jgi:hypothetical protein
MLREPVCGAFVSNNLLLRSILYVPGGWSVAQEGWEIVRYLCQIVMGWSYWQVLEVGSGKVDDLLLQLRE